MTSRMLCSTKLQVKAWSTLASKFTNTKQSKMKKFNSIYLLFLGLLISTAAFSQDATNAAPAEEAGPTFTLSGSVDSYFRTGFGYKTYSPTTSFATGKGFSIGMANIIASYAGE